MRFTIKQSDAEYLIKLLGRQRYDRVALLLQDFGPQYQRQMIEANNRATRQPNKR